MKLLLTVCCFLAVAAASSTIVLAHDANPHLKRHWSAFLSGDRKHHHPEAVRAHNEHLMRQHADDELTYNAVMAEHGPRMHRAHPAEIGKMSCTECKLVVGLLQNMTSTAAGRNETVALLDTFCVAEGAKKNWTAGEISLCKSLGAVVVDLLPVLWKGLNSLAWDIPLNLCSLLLKACTQPCCSTPTVPEQIFLSFANNSDWYSSLRVTWTTLVPTPGAKVEVGRIGGAATSFAEGPTRTYTYGGWLGTIHSAVMTGLEANTTYWYQIWSDGSTSSPKITFRTMSKNIGTSTAEPLRIGQIADCGYGPNSDDTISQLTKLADPNHPERIHLLHHAGDVGYSDGEQNHFDDWMRKVSPIVSRVPCVVGEGNHESVWNNFGDDFRIRIGMAMALDVSPANATSVFSQMVGPVQLLMLNSETPIDTANIGKDQLALTQQYIDRFAPSRKWLIAAHHRPLFCTGGGKLQCEIFSALLRLQALPFYIQNKVDFLITGHIHAYERSAVLNVLGEPISTNYTNPQGLIQGVMGQSGNREGNGGGTQGHPSWRVVGDNSIGFTIQTVTGDSYNVRAVRSVDMSKVDDFTIVKK
jgi:hypothetical protein